MRVHTILVGGPFDGELVTLWTKGVPEEIRIGRVFDSTRPGKIPAHVYRLTDVEKGVSSTHKNAGYAYVGEVQTATELVDHWLFKGKV